MKMKNKKFRFAEGALCLSTVEEVEKEFLSEGIDPEKDCFIELRMGREQDGWNLDSYIDSGEFSENFDFEIVDGKISLEALKTILKSIVVIDQSAVYNGRTDTAI